MQSTSLLNVFLVNNLIFSAVVLSLFVDLATSALLNALSILASTKILEFKASSFKKSIKPAAWLLLFVVAYTGLSVLLSSWLDIHMFMFLGLGLVLYQVLLTLLIHRFFQETALRSFISGLLSSAINLIPQLFILGMVAFSLFSLGLAAVGIQVTNELENDPRYESLLEQMEDYREYGIENLEGEKFSEFFEDAKLYDQVKNEAVDKILKEHGIHFNLNPNPTLE